MRTEDASENYVREVTARYIGPRRKGLFIAGPSDAAHFMRGVLRDDAREHFIALYLNGANQVISFSLVSLGSANYALVHPREIFQGAVLVGACGIVIGHNHPSGDLKPSSEDKAVTKKLRDVGEIIGIKVLDHVLFSESGYMSFNDYGI